MKPFQQEDSRKTRDRRFKDKTPDLPLPGQYQQTLKTSFTVGGLGLHTADYAFVRVRPAYAGEGRYFVRVPEGTNSGRFKMEGHEKEIAMEYLDEEGVDGDKDPEAQDLQAQLFLEYLNLQDTQGYEGSFGDFVGKDLVGQIDGLLDQIIDNETEPEEIVERSEAQPYVLASLDSVTTDDPMFTTLGSGDDRVQGVEHLLSALEMLGIDNARIEIEGGHEVPIVDGSALGWTIDCQAAGTRKAVQPGTKDSMKMRRQPVVREPVLVTGDDGAFVSFVPGSTQQLSAGVDHAAVAPIIGRQFASWAAGGGETEHYRWKVAPARNYAESTDALQQLRARGYIKGGTADCSIIAYGDRWYDPGQIRFHDDEPARHKLVDLSGDLSLLARNGGGGVPDGHILAYKADHKLHAKFLRALAAKATHES